MVEGYGKAFKALNFDIVCFIFILYFCSSLNIKKMTKEQSKRVIRALNAYHKNTSTIRVCDWGSCQYNGAYETYKLVLKLISILGYEEFCSLWGITHTPITQTEVELAADMINGEIEYANERYDDDPEYWADYRAEAEAVPHTVEGYMGFLRNKAFDLWSAIFNPLPGYEMTKNPQLDRVPDGLPLLNALAWDDNFTTGLYAAMLTHHYGVQGTAFMDFDT